MAYRNELAALREREEGLRLEIQELEAELDDLGSAIAAAEDEAWSAKAPPPPPDVVWETRPARGVLIGSAVLAGVVALAGVISPQPWSEKGSVVVVFVLFILGFGALVYRLMSAARGIRTSEDGVTVRTPQRSWTGDWHQAEGVRVDSVRLEQAYLHHFWIKRDGVWHDYDLGAVPDETMKLLRRWRDWHARAMKAGS